MQVVVSGNVPVVTVQYLETTTDTVWKTLVTDGDMVTTGGSFIVPPAERSMVRLKVILQGTPADSSDSYNVTLDVIGCQHITST